MALDNEIAVKRAEILYLEAYIQYMRIEAFLGDCLVNGSAGQLIRAKRLFLMSRRRTVRRYHRWQSMRKTMARKMNPRRLPVPDVEGSSSTNGDNGVSVQ